MRLLYQKEKGGDDLRREMERSDAWDLPGVFGPGVNWRVVFLMIFRLFPDG